MGVSREDVGHMVESSSRNGSVGVVPGITRRRRYSSHRGPCSGIERAWSLFLSAEAALADTPLLPLCATALSL